MTLIKDLIEIPEQVHKGDFVLRLAEGVQHADETLRDYVVTPELTAHFADALSFIRSAIQSRTSKATYLHGSFGSGKSHFMAVLHLILQGNSAARAIPELAPVIQNHNAWISGKKFLLVPYHMIGAHDMESGILGGYAEHVRRTHPTAPIPAVFRAEGLLRDAAVIRSRMGDEAFFQMLNEGRSATGWGDLDAGWDAARFDEAIEALPYSESRTQLISTLISKLFASYDVQASGRGEAFVSLDHGLSIISKHAASLGYEALILFLDELILWLASHAADLRFVHQEGQKLVKLVEPQTPDRPAPIISFIARQRDLRELIGDSIPGADRLNFGDALKHWEDRFHRITLEDRNLPVIAERRILKPKSESARRELDADFEKTARMRESVMNVLLTSEGDRRMFRRVYPFSPALVQTLIAVSSVLQRERTALKVMLQLLVDQRETLKVGDIVPIGDLFDVIAHGDEAFSQEMAIYFDNAVRLYHQKLLPELERQHGFRREDAEALPYDDPVRAAFRSDDRLIKTLLLAALVPEVESLRALTPERLAALNHGTIKTPIPGREGQEVLRRCRAWGSKIGEIRIGEESNPTISVQLSGVDTEPIIQQASREDNQGNRIRRVRQMLFDQFEIEGQGEFEQHYEFLWRNTKRTCTILFRNIRELPDASLVNTGVDWKLIIDFPFDEPGHGPKDDHGKLQTFLHAHPEGTKTLCWIPAFLSADAQKDLGTLVILEHVLTGERFSQYSNHLSPQDRQAAKSLLENQRSVLRQRVQNHLDAAYGLEAISPGSLDMMQDLELSERFVSLWSGFDPQPPVAANLGQAMEHFLTQALDYEFPAGPFFEGEVKASSLKKVCEEVLKATQAQDGWVPVDKTVRPLLRQIANPLMLGEMGVDTNHFVLGHHWKNHFHKKAAGTGAVLTVGELRKWMDEPRAMGVPKEAQNLVILVFAAQTNRTFYRHGVAIEPQLTNIPDECELREQRLPDASRWTTAVNRAGAIFGLGISPLLNATNVNTLNRDIQKKALDARRPCQQFYSRLRHRLEAIGAPPKNANRFKTASATYTMVEALSGADIADIVGKLAGAEIASTETAMGECVRKSAELDGNLETAGWEVFEAIGELEDNRRSEAQQILRDVRAALENDEHVIPLAPALKAAQLAAVRLLRRVSEKPKPVEAPPGTPGRRVFGTGSRKNLLPGEAKAAIEQVESDLSPGRTVRFDLTWIVEDKAEERSES